ITIALAACQPDSTMIELPTLAILPSLTPTAADVVVQVNLPPTWTPTDTPTITSTATHTPTITNTPTPTSTATNTLTPTSTFTPTPMGDARVSGANGVNLRSGPSTRFSPALALLEPDTELILTGRTANSLWYQIQTFDGRSGWVSASLVEARIDPALLAVVWIATPTPPPLVVALPPVGNAPVI